MTEEKPHVLVVDDDPSICEALSTGLSYTYTVHCAGTGREAFALLEREPIAAIILDAVLGKERGLDLVANFRTMSFAPILMLTGHSSEELVVEAFRVGIDGYLRKPMDLIAVLQALSRMLQKPEVPPPWPHMPPGSGEPPKNGRH